MRCEECGHTQEGGRFCGRCGALVVPPPSGGGLPPGGSSEVEGERERLGRRRLPVLPVAAAVVVLAAVVVAVTSGQEPQPASSDEPPEEAGEVEEQEESSPGIRPEAGADDASISDDARWPLTFPDDGIVLVFDDGQEGAIVLDVATGASHRVRLPQRPGDQPYRLWRVGERVAVGRDPVHLVSLHPDGPPAVRLPAARSLLPAAEADHLWLIGNRFDGGGSDEPFWSLVGPHGNLVASLTNMDTDAQPIRGIPGGLAVQTESGRVHLLDLLGRLHTDHFSDRPVHVADASADRVVWCQDPCEDLHVSTGDGALVASIWGDDIEGDNVRDFFPDLVWMSHDGERVAAVVMVDHPSGGVDRELRIYQLDPGPQQLARMPIPLGDVHSTWTPDGRTFYFAVNQPVGTVGGPQLLGRWTTGGQIRQVDVAPHLTGLRDVVALPRDAVHLPDVAD